MYWLKQLKDKTLKVIATAIDYNRNTSSMPNEGNTTITCWVIFIHAKISKHQYAASDVLTMLEKITRYLQGK